MTATLRIKLESDLDIELPNGTILHLQADGGDIRISTRSLSATVRKSGRPAKASKRAMDDIAMEAEGRKATRRHKGSRQVRKGAGRRPGRQPSQERLALRELIKADKANGGIKDAGAYVKVLAAKHDVPLKRAKPMVYAELKASK